MSKFTYLLAGLLVFVLSGISFTFGRNEQHNARVWELGIAPPIYSEIEDQLAELQDTLQGEDIKLAEEMFLLFSENKIEDLRKIWQTYLNTHDKSDNKLTEFAEYLIASSASFIDQKYNVLLRQLPAIRHPEAKQALDSYLAKDSEAMGKQRKKLYRAGDEESALIMGFIDEITVNLRVSSHRFTLAMVCYALSILALLLGLGLCFLWFRAYKLRSQLNEENSEPVPAE